MEMERDVIFLILFLACFSVLITSVARPVHVPVFKTLFTSSCDCSTPAVVGYCVYKSCPVLSAGTLVSFSSELWHLCLKEANKNGWFSSVERLRFAMVNGNVEILRNATGIFFFLDRICIS